MRIGGVRHGRLPFGTKRELLSEDGGCRKMDSVSRRGAAEKRRKLSRPLDRHPGLDPGSGFLCARAALPRKAKPRIKSGAT